MQCLRRNFQAMSVVKVREEPDDVSRKVILIHYNQRRQIV